MGKAAAVKNEPKRGKKTSPLEIEVGVMIQPLARPLDFILVHLPMLDAIRDAIDKSCSTESPITAVEGTLSHRERLLSYQQRILLVR